MLVLIKPRISNQRTLTSSTTSENLHVWNQFKFCSIAIEIYRWQNKEWITTLVFEIIENVNLESMKVISSTENNPSQCFLKQFQD